MSLELKVAVWETPNGADVAIDAVRCAKLALVDSAEIAASAVYPRRRT